MNTTLKTLTLAAAASMAVSAYAGDKEVLDLLVKKGVVSAEERAAAMDKAKKASQAAGLDEIFAKEEALKRLTFSGRMQTQYEDIAYEQTGASNAGEASPTRTFLMRRLYLGFKADMGSGFSGEIVNNFAENETDKTLDKAIVTSESSLGNITLGYQKVQWGLEENTSSSKLYTVERSMVTRYWAESENGRRIGFGARHVGLHYSDKATLSTEDTLDYGFSFVDARQGYSKTSVNDFGTYANIALTHKFSDANKHTIGVNWGQTFYTSAAGAITVLNDESSKISGYNPYIKSQIGAFTLQGEYVLTDIDATSGTLASAGGVERSPTGYNAILAYKISDGLEAVARFSHLDTDGRGQKAGDGVRDTITTGIATENTWDKSDSVYLGLNFYFVEHNAKLMVGYERVKFTDRISGYGLDGSATTSSLSEGQANALRVQAQILF